MLWIGGQITAANIIIKLFIPAVISLLIPVLLIGFIFKGKIQKPGNASDNDDTRIPDKRESIFVFTTGIILLLLVPVFKTVTHLPPFMGMLISLGIFWIIIERIHRRKEEEYRKKYTVANALRRIDTPSILFFL